MTHFHSTRRGIGALLAAASGAAAQTTIPGGTLATQTWTTAGSPYTIQGDVTVPSGNLLTIQPGVTVLVAATDSLAAGLDPARVEITIQGALSCAGSVASPISIHAAAGSASALWYGIVISAGATGATISETSIQNTVSAVSMSGGSVGLHHDTISAARDNAVVLTAGSLAADRCTIFGGAVGINVAGGGGTVTNCFFSGQGAGVLAASGGFTNVVTLTHCTLFQCGDGVSLGAGNGTVNVRNSIIAASQNYGVYRAPGGTVQSTIIYSDVYSATGLGNYSGGPVAGTGTISADPLLTSPTDPHPLPGSPCIDSASAIYCSATDLYGTVRPQGPVCDMGAVEVVAACYANCDGSTAAPVLNVQDFTCFLQKFASGDSYANCDGSTSPPSLNVQDFTCFLQKFASGCP